MLGTPPCFLANYLNKPIFSLLMCCWRFVNWPMTYFTTVNQNKHRGPGKEKKEKDAKVRKNGIKSNKQKGQIEMGKKVSLEST
jgi:hypothetical protein